MPPLTSSAINKGKTLAPKAVARRRPAAAPKPAQPAPSPDTPASADDAAAPSNQASASQPESQQPPQHHASIAQQPPAADIPLPTPPPTQQSARNPTPPPPPPVSRLEPSPLSLAQSATSSAPSSYQNRPLSPPATQQSSAPQSSIETVPSAAPEPTRQPSPAATVITSQQPTSDLAPSSPTQLAGQKRKRPSPPPTTTPAQSSSTTPPVQSSLVQDAAPVAHSETEAALINGLIGHQEYHQAPVAQMLPPANIPRTDPKPRAKRQRKTAPAPSAEGAEDSPQAGAGAQEDNAGHATTAKPKKPRAPRAKRTPKSAATVVEDENGNIVESEAPAESTRPAPKPRKPRQKKQKPQQGEGENEEAGQDEPIEDPENHEIDISVTTMLDLTRDRGYGKVSERETKMAAIDWDAVHKQRMAEAEAIRAGQDPAVVSKQPIENTEDGEGGDGGEGETNQETPRPPPIVSGPRLRLDAEGNLVVDEDSLRIDRQAQAARNAENLVATENDDLTKRVNQMSWINERRRDPTDRVPFFKMKSDPWSEEETDRFYEALAMFGTDFFIISKMFPPKTRRQIKLKFIREERLEPDRVNRALAGDAVPMKLESFAEATGQDLEGFKDPRELDEELRVEGEEQREEIARKKKEIEEAKKQRDIQMAAREKDQEERAAQRREKAAMRQNRRRGIFGTGTF